MFKIKPAIVIDFIKVSLCIIAFSVILKIPISFTPGIFHVMGKLISVNLRSRLFCSRCFQFLLSLLLVNLFFHYVFSTNTFLPFTWFLLRPYTHFTLQFSQHVLSTDDDCAFYPMVFKSRDLHLSHSYILHYALYTIFNDAFYTKANRAFY